MSSNKIPCHCGRCRGGLVSKRTEREHRNGPVVRQEKQITGRKRQRMAYGIGSYHAYYLNFELILCIAIAVSDEEIDGPMGDDQTTRKQDNVCLPTELLVIWRC